MAGRPIGKDGQTYLDSLLVQALERCDELSDFQVDFAMSLTDRIDRYGRNTFMTGKQWDVVAGIAKKLDLPEPREAGNGTAA
mgnify:CR=1 FL=1